MRASRRPFESNTRLRLPLSGTRAPMLFITAQRSPGMRISKKMVQALNKQIKLEDNASQFYLAAASWAEGAGYEGAAAYYYAQSDEERAHMLKVVKFLNSLGISPTIPAVSEPAASHESLEDSLKASLKNEQAVTEAVHALLTLASKNSDYSVLELLEWFASEQAHEETKFEAILQKFDTIGRDGLAVAEIDRILASQAGSC